jgi:hypothetical protein
LDVEEVARKKHKFDDNAFLEESREINDNVRSAVSAGKLIPVASPAELMYRSSQEDDEEEGSCWSWS